MKLTDHEKSMLDGAQGRARQKAMELLARYGEALGAERLVETKNAATVTTVTNPVVRKVAMEHGMDGVFSRFNLDSDEIVETPQFEASTCQLIHGIYRDEAREFGVPEEAIRLHAQSELFFGRRGVHMLSTCTPYQVGNVPVQGRALRVDGILGGGLLQRRARRAHQHRRTREHRRRQRDRTDSLLGAPHPREPLRHPSVRRRNRRSTT